MGSVSMQSQACSRGERLSAFVDGESLGEIEGFGSLFAELNGEDRAAWSSYHLIGDALRSDDLAVSSATSSAFLAGFAARLEAEPHVLAPAAVPASKPLSALRRRVVPVFAVAAAAATLTWIVVPQLQRVDGASGGVQTASVGSDSVQRVAMASAPTGPTRPAQEMNIIRDASLDQYLEAHQQFAQQPVVPGSMPLIRAAAVTSQGQ
ncbi:sigma-E factor negative regulatory protein [Trinickia mobilis]|uniref:sigma-E factor negative regulatory protein n=1 Tax=Trinickia mobilis TaxID=2816356 RepID=UPI001A8D221E|nr:sigma-E factor negative regulatory protein [Trinickia mobilis]